MGSVLIPQAYYIYIFMLQSRREAVVEKQVKGFRPRERGKGGGPPLNGIQRIFELIHSEGNKIYSKKEYNIF